MFARFGRAPPAFRKPLEDRSPAPRQQSNYTQYNDVQESEDMMDRLKTLTQRLRELEHKLSYFAEDYRRLDDVMISAALDYLNLPANDDEFVSALMNNCVADSSHRDRIDDTAWIDASDFFKHMFKYIDPRLGSIGYAQYVSLDRENMSLRRLEGIFAVCVSSRRKALEIAALSKQNKQLQRDLERLKFNDLHPEEAAAFYRSKSPKVDRLHAGMNSHRKVLSTAGRTTPGMLDVPHDTEGFVSGDVIETSRRGRAYQRMSRTPEPPTHSPNHRLTTPIQSATQPIRLKRSNPSRYRREQSEPSSHRRRSTHFRPQTNTLSINPNATATMNNQFFAELAQTPDTSRASPLPTQPPPLPPSIISSSPEQSYHRQHRRRPTREFNAATNIILHETADLNGEASPTRTEKKKKRGSSVLIIDGDLNDSDSDDDERVQFIPHSVKMNVNKKQSSSGDDGGDSPPTRSGRRKRPRGPARRKINSSNFGSKRIVAGGGGGGHLHPPPAPVPMREEDHRDVVLVQTKTNPRRASEFHTTNSSTVTTPSRKSRSLSYSSPAQMETVKYFPGEDSHDRELEERMIEQRRTYDNKWMKIWKEYTDRFEYLEQRYLKYLHDRDAAWGRWRELLEEFDSLANDPNQIGKPTFGKLKCQECIDFVRMSLGTFDGWLFCYQPSAGSASPWKKRYAVLMDFHIFFYEEQFQPENLQQALRRQNFVLPLYSMKDVKTRGEDDIEDDGSSPVASDIFIITTIGKSVTFRAPDEALCSDWTMELKYHLSLFTDLLDIEHIRARPADRTENLWLPVYYLKQKKMLQENQSDKGLRSIPENGRKGNSSGKHVRRV